MHFVTIRAVEYGGAAYRLEIAFFNTRGNVRIRVLAEPPARQHDMRDAPEGPTAPSAADTAISGLAGRRH